MSKLPKIIKSLPRQVTDALVDYSTRLEKTYRYQQMEPLYIPFYKQLNRLFNNQRIAFKKSGIVESLWSKKKKLSKGYVESFVKSNFIPDDKLFYSEVSKTYLKQYNLIKSIFKDPAVDELTKAQKIELQKIVKNINNYTLKRISNTLYKARKSKWSLRKTRVEVKQLFKDMAYYRAERISKTELTRSQNQSILSFLKSVGAVRKQWVLCKACSEEGSCITCKDNARKGKISIDKTFPSGHLYPPAHPNCTCGIR